MSDNQFKSKIGLVAATVGSAVGLGNIWRFPAEAQANGGAAFLLLYVGCVVLLGIPVMLAEFALGRGGKSDSFKVFRNLAPGKKWWIVGLMGIIASYLISIFYMVVEGWTLEYIWQSVTGGLYEGVGQLAGNGDIARADSVFTSRMAEYINTPFAPILFTVLCILLNMAILTGGVQKGIERLSNVLMPLLFVVLLVLGCVTLSLPGAGDGVAWFLKPDFSKITPVTFINAMGQAFFSLSLGMGILITYSAYYPANTKLTPTASIVAAMSLVVALMVGFVIFPAVSSFGLADHSLVGTTLVFQTLPEVFSCLPATRVWSTLFFVLLFMAALTSTVSLLEVTVAFLQESLGLSRRAACVAALSPLLVLSSVCSLSFSSLSDITFIGMNIFGLLDAFTTNIMLPLTAIGTCVFLGWFAPKHLLRRQLTNDGSIRSRIVGSVMFIIRFLAPVIIAIILVARFV